MPLKQHTSLKPFLKRKQATLASLLFASLLTGNALAAPMCISAASDQDGDGWGWESNQSCMVGNTTVVTNNNSNTTPICQTSSDSDNDGWGWENNRSCIFQNNVVNTETPTSSGTPQCSSASSDFDNDGWGWENNRSCIVSNNTPTTTTPTNGGTPTCASANSDDNNDGWGWENNRSCRVSDNTPTPTPTPTTLKVMAVGDSITHGVQGQTSYRRPLHAKLTQAGCKYTFVGSQTSNYLSNSFNQRHEGYTSQTADEFLTGVTNHAGTNKGIAHSMRTYNPDVVLLHIGTNDMRLGQNIDNTLSEIDQIISIIHQNNNSTVVLVANLIPWYLSAQGAVQSLGSKIEAYVAQLGNPKVKIVDVRSGYQLNMMISDRVHPNATGEEHIARAFFNAYRNANLCN